MRGLSHPCIIKFFGSDARLSTIYMEYLPYPDLSGWIKTTISDRYLFSGNMDDARRVLRDVASALVYLEEQQVLHNDLKPGNIIYDRDRGGVLIDFGLACTPRDACNGGTPWYLPPEFIEDGKREFASDVFALGVTMLYLLQMTRLPDVTEPGWLIPHVFTDVTQDRKMRAWLEKVDRLAQRLGVTGIEPVVRAMLEEEPGQRISAADIGRRLSEEL
ncbi:hypothetical protein G6O67_003521 [Ophiocordyceps sinensis]|uniref:Protein kinase domain-containing protein n=1 Tax=Ophiocordyceps sinensis TaxID=72228 RepID=A0A8H4V632_9HYPO|nr:hypothetical protein G6O67_003521 [Ophiocordyceps sinensis]